MKSSPAKRYLWSDLLRVFAICLVVLAHSSPATVNEHSTPWLSLILFSLGKCGVPLFVMLSGALLLGKKESNTIFFKKRMHRIVLPWVFWTVILILYRYLSHQVVMTSPLFLVTYFKVTFTTDFWFMPMILCLYLLTPFLRSGTTATSSSLVVVLILWFFSVSLLPYVHSSEAFPLHTDNSLLRQTIQYLGYYLLGYYLNKRSTLNILVTICMSIMGVGGAVLSYTLTRRPDLFDYFSPFIIVSSVGIFLLLRELFPLPYSPITQQKSRLLFLLSTSSYGVMFLHYVYLQLLPKTLVPLRESALGTILLFLYAVLLSYASILLLGSIPHLKKLVT